MKKLKFIKYNDIQDILEKNTLNIIYGLSEFVKENNFPNIQYICDNNKELWNTTHNNIRIISPELLCDFKYFNIIIWNNHVEKIINSLNLDLKIANIYVLYDHLRDDIFKITYKYLNNNYVLDYKKILFKELVELIEIEPHSYCNRTCWFCPNSFIDRKSKVNYFSENILNQLLEDLSSIDYSKTISFTRYAEPFGNEIFYPTLRKVHSHLPNALLHANTNGDFLTNNSLELAYENGLRSLNIQLYLKKDQIFNEEIVNYLAKKILKRTSNLKYRLEFITSDWIQYKCNYKDMKINMYARNFIKNGTDRATLNILETKYERTAPCIKVFTDVYIDYNATIVPCCNIRSDFKEHQEFNFGKLSTLKNSIFELYFSNTAKKWRQHLITTNVKKISPCKTCNFSNKNNYLISKYSDFLQDEKKTKI